MGERMVENDDEIGERRSRDEDEGVGNVNGMADDGMRRREWTEGSLNDGKSPQGRGRNDRGAGVLDEIEGGNEKDNVGTSVPDVSRCDPVSSWRRNSFSLDPSPFVAEMAHMLNGRVHRMGKVVKRKLRKALAFKDILAREDSVVSLGLEADDEDTPVTPFSYHYQPSVTDFFLMAAMLPVLPFRMLLAGLSMILAWSVAKVALYNLPDQVINAAPFTGWRHVCRCIVLAMARVLFFSLGIQRIEYVGETHFQPSSVAPVLICAPHVSYLDAFVSGVISIMPVMKAQAGKAPIFGPFLSALQPIYVNREDKESRSNTKETLIKRCSAEKGIWPPVLIFPEGTTSNGQCLFKFKLGAFYPGQPIQMTSVEYVSCMSSWNPLIMAWDSSVPVWVAILYLFLQPHITARIHFQPVYYPSKEEQEDPALFASNVQQKMADYLVVPATEYTYENVRDFLRKLRLKRRKSS